MRITRIMTLAFLIGVFANFYGQDDLLKSLDSASEKPKMNVATAFKTLQVVNMQSTKLPAKKEFYLLISHRFGSLSLGDLDSFADNFFGLDNATTKICGVYGITEWLSVEASRQTLKLYEFGTKYRLVSQSENFPVTLVGRNTMNIDTSLKQATYPEIKFNDKLSFANEILISKKLSDRVSLQVAGIWVHNNLIDQAILKKDQQVAAIGGRIKISNRVSINGEYGYRFSPMENTVYHNPVSLGLDIDTGGHVFQIILSNSQKMSDVSYYNGANGNIGKGNIFLGFNMYRVF